MYCFFLCFHINHLHRTMVVKFDLFSFEGNLSRYSKFRSFLIHSAWGNFFGPRIDKVYSILQCSGSESVSGSTCFWASRIRIHQSEVWIRILLSSSKNSKKNLDSYCFVTFLGHFIFEKLVPSKKISRKTFFLLVFCWPLEGQ